MRKLAAFDHLDETDPSPAPRQPARSGARGQHTNAEKPASDSLDSTEPVDAFAVLEALTGSIEAPSDWAAEHDHYLYGTPKRGKQAT